MIQPSLGMDDTRCLRPRLLQVAGLVDMVACFSGLVWLVPLISIVVVIVVVVVVVLVVSCCRYHHRRHGCCVALPAYAALNVPPLYLSTTAPPDISIYIPSLPSSLPPSLPPSLSGSWQVKVVGFTLLLVVLATCASVADNTMTDGLLDCLWSLCEDA